MDAALLCASLHLCRSAMRHHGARWYQHSNGKIPSGQGGSGPMSEEFWHSTHGEQHLRFRYLPGPELLWAAS